jgi:hypothetical protein
LIRLDQDKTIFDKNNTRIKLVISTETENQKHTEPTAGEE